MTQAGIERGSCGAHVGGVRSFPPFSAVSVAAHVAHTRARGRRGCGQPCSAKSPTRKVRVRRSSCVAGDHVISRTCVYVRACMRACVCVCVRACVRACARESLSPCRGAADAQARARTYAARSGPRTARARAARAKAGAAFRSRRRRRRAMRPVLTPRSGTAAGALATYRLSTSRRPPKRARRQRRRRWPSSSCAFGPKKTSSCRCTLKWAACLSARRYGAVPSVCLCMDRPARRYQR